MCVVLRGYLKTVFPEHATLPSIFEKCLGLDNMFSFYNAIFLQNCYVTLQSGKLLMKNIYPRLYTPFCKTYLMCLLLLLSGISASAQQSPGLTPLDVAKIEYVQHAIITPGGNKIAYTLEKPADPLKENEPAEYHLYLFDLLSKESVPFVTTMSVSSVKFRPGNNSITFLARREGEKINSLYEISLAGGEAQKLYSFATTIHDYDWAPDGNRLAFMASQPVSKSNSVSPSLPYEPEIYEENTPQRRGYITSINRQEYRPRPLSVQGSVYQMHWSPDGSRLVVAVSPTSLTDDYHINQKVLIMNGEGTDVLAEVDHRGKLGQIGWSPDGNYLAMIAGTDIHDPVAGRLFVVSADGGRPNNLRPDFEGTFEQFQWINNQTLHYLASRGVWSSYGQIDRNGSEMQTIVHAGEPNLNMFSRSRTGTSVFVGDTPKHPNEIFILKSDDQFPRRLTNSNPWLRDIDLGRQEVVTWQTQDSVELQGMLIYPVNYTSGNSYPLITVVHGGPENHYNNGWLTSYAEIGQVAAARGFFVFYPNYRGSSGRGVAFARSSQNDLAGAEFNDIVEGIDQLTAVGIADENRIGVMGASYGGYAVAWLSTKYTSRFAAGVMLSGISNNLSRWATSDIPQELYLAHMHRHLWEDYQYYLERSPIYYAGQAGTPLLIATGKEDARVHPGQSHELYRHIKTRTDTPVRLILYPDERHGLSGSMARLDYNVRAIRWFGQYLKGELQHPDSEVESNPVIVR